MKYLLLASREAAVWGAMGPEAQALLLHACHDNAAVLRARGQLLAMISPDWSQGVLTVRRQGEGLTVSDGGSVADEARLTTIFTICAHDLNEAIQVAATLPEARLGPIEIWPLRETDSVLTPSECFP